MSRLPLAARLALVVLVAIDAYGHRINLLVLPEGARAMGHAYYADGTPASGASIAVHDVSGTVLAQLQTDEEGRFEFTPQGSGTFTFVVETDDGHRAEAAIVLGAPDVSDSAVPQSQPAGAMRPVDEIERVVQQAVAPLRIQLDAYERKTRFRDILGGMGYIVGVVGLLAWWKSRRGTDA